MRRALLALSADIRRVAGNNNPATHCEWARRIEALASQTAQGEAVAWRKFPDELPPPGTECLVELPFLGGTYRAVDRWELQRDAPLEWSSATVVTGMGWSDYGDDVLRWIPIDNVTAPPAPSASFQERVQPWLLECFGELIAGDRVERNHRFLEEALELVQSCGCTDAEAHQLVDYVFGRPVGEPKQESGGVSVTHAALCLANGIDMHEAAEAELARIWTKVEAIRAKQAAKPKHSPLPQQPGNGGLVEVSEELKARAAAMMQPAPAPAAPLPRYGIKWRGPEEPVAVPMPDGYWTPWHLASAPTCPDAPLREPPR